MGLHGYSSRQQSAAGRALLSSLGGLTGDLVHPFDTGMAQMAWSLAASLRKLPVVQCLLPG